VIAFDDVNRVLMQLRSDTRTWGFPGGSSELGDSLLETAQRELLEETGLTASSWTFVTMLSGQKFFSPTRTAIRFTTSPPCTSLEKSQAICARITKVSSCAGLK
jgi:8-oxo-dGTP pyrophosphatase MutT (NUDIX family)